MESARRLIPADLRLNRRGPICVARSPRPFLAAACASAAERLDDCLVQTGGVRFQGPAAARRTKVIQISLVHLRQDGLLNGKQIEILLRRSERDVRAIITDA
jgi:hypothetical protein